jgi:O-glycosyl hydrolase
VPAGFIRIDATINNDQLKTVAFRTLKGRLGALVLNRSDTQDISIKIEGKAANFNLPKQSVTTLVWEGIKMKIIN